MNDVLPGVLRGLGIPPGLLNGHGRGERGSVSHGVYGSTEEYIYDFNAGLPRLLAEKDNGNLTDYLYDGRLYEGIISGQAGESYGQGPDGSVPPGMYGGPPDGDATGAVSGSVYGEGPGYRFPGFGPGNQGYRGGMWPNPWRIPDGRAFYLQDGLGSVDALTDMNGLVLERYSYDAFGQPRVEGERISNPFMFTGEPYDQTDGLLYLRTRYYDPRIGRFLSQDTFFGRLTDPLSENLYDYAENNPILNVDPTGHGNVAGWLPGNNYSDYNLATYTGNGQLDISLASAYSDEQTNGQLYDYIRQHPSLAKRGTDADIIEILAGIAVSAGSPYALPLLKKLVSSLLGGIDEGAGEAESQWYNPDGSINYPPNGGAIPGTEETISLNPGDIIGRYGEVTPKSNYVSEPGATPDQLSLPPSVNSSIYREYKIVQQIPEVIRSEVVPWGG
ncbi:MAG: RHS repeat-associated core domain-containing protein [Peptococcaceae bacterium]|jgi:RHS repeat-associated protein|nr:RHS repeat-associated core domain-containing protein [Peptococcaceae bacterium]